MGDATNATISEQYGFISHILIDGCSGGRQAIVPRGLEMINQDLMAAEMATMERSELVEVRYPSKYSSFRRLLRAQPSLLQ